MSDSAAADCRQNTVRLRRVDAAAWISRVYRSQCCSASHASARTYTPWRRRLSSPASACRASLRESRPRRARSLLRIRAGRSIHRYWPPHRSHNNSPAPGCGKHWQRIRGAFRQALRFRTRAPRIRAGVVRNRSRNTPASPLPCLSAPPSSETVAETRRQAHSRAYPPRRRPKPQRKRAGGPTLRRAPRPRRRRRRPGCACADPAARAGPCAPR